MVSHLHLTYINRILRFIFVIKNTTHHNNFIQNTIIIILKKFFFINFFALFLSPYYSHTILDTSQLHLNDYNKHNIYPIINFIFTLYSKSKNANKFGCLKPTFF